MNRKGQFGFLRLIAFVGMFLLLFSLALAPVMSTFLGVANLDVLGGFGSFMLGNLPLWVLIGFVIAVIFYLVFGGD